ncbi:MAG: Na+/H+ antiporter [Gemmatimonadota bacterium]
MIADGSLIILFCIATGVAMVVHRLRVPYTVALVIVGLGLGAVHAIEPPHLTKELLFTIFLPGLLFEAAFHLAFADFRKNWLAISALAIPGVVVAVAVTALLATAVIGTLGLDSTFTAGYGLVFGALVAATDPVAVTALFRQLNVPKRLTALVEGESLLNDGTSIIFLGLVLSYVSGSSPTLLGLAGDFVSVTGGGALVGAAVGIVVSWAIGRIDDAMIEIALTTIAAYGSFVLAEQWHVSGVIATVTAGMLCGSYGRPTGMSATTRIAVETFWEYVAFALNSIVFLLIGFEVPVKTLVGFWPEILAAFVAVLLARGVVVIGVTALLRRTAERLPDRWSWILVWGGLRGGLSMVLALSLAPSFPHRDILVRMTVGVVVLSLLVQGITMAPLLRRLGLIRADDGSLEGELAAARMKVAGSAMAEIDRLARNHAAPSRFLDRLREHYDELRRQAEQRVEAIHDSGDDASREAAAQIVRQLLMVEQDRLASGRGDGTIARKAYRILSAEVAARLQRLDREEVGDPVDLLIPSPQAGAEPRLPNGS